ncbi:hypothetical protein BS47DRAFT_1028156 [Hydnum rufescens UP504]|uniref:Uncharacterized protein n=1 Tax=Hydnum rufescens UP504 TaxID=1448309 RepID=A0A9P6ACV0_9AGAM|nr:hypothetical protein BS47DRAFT_1028156 [Hydnum rufescens UP504]
MSTSFLWQVKLMKIASSIMDVVYGMTGVARRGIDLAQVAQLHADLRAWERSLPRELRIAPNTLSTCSSPPDVFMINLAFHWLLILLLHPFFKPHIKVQPPSFSEIPSSGGSTKRRDFALLKLREAALNECPTSATHILSLFAAYRRLYTLRLTPVTAVQIAYTAGKTHLATILAGGPNPSTKARKAKGEFLECVQILKEIGESWASGRLTAEMLQTLLVRGEKRMQQALVAAPSQAGVRSYDPPPGPPPAKRDFLLYPDSVCSVLITIIFL